MKKKFLINDDLWIVKEEWRENDTFYHVIRRRLKDNTIKYKTYKKYLKSVWVLMLSKYKLQLGIFYLNGIIYKIEGGKVYYRAAADICSNNFHMFEAENYEKAAQKIITAYGESYNENE